MRDGKKRFTSVYVPKDPSVPHPIMLDRTPYIDHCFRRGHRIMVQVQSSWFPLGDRNRQKFLDIFNAKVADFVKATEGVYHTPAAMSGVKVDVRAK